MIRRSERGSLFTILLGAVALSAALSLATYQLLSGPVASMSRITKKAMVDTQMLAASKIAIMDATNQAASGDCDADGSVEVREWRDTAGGKPANGGLIPLTIGAPVTDPWNSDYGYCVWDVGSFSDPLTDNGCGVAAKRLEGTPTPTAGVTNTQTVLAVISAGADRVFTTTCKNYSASVDDATHSTTDLIATSGDDVVMRYTYAEAAAATSSLWSIKVGAPEVAEIAKDLEITAGGGGTGSIIATGGIKPGTEATISACAAGTNVGMIRYNTGTPGLEVCNGAAGWEAVGTSEADTFQPDAAINCAEDIAPADAVSDHIGEVRYNTTTELPEFCDGTGWRPFALAIPGVNLILSPASATMNVDGAVNEDPATCSVAGWNCGLETTFTLTNTGSTTSAAPVTALTNSTNFVITSNTCDANPLDANEACLIKIRPKANGNLTYTGNLNITANNNPFATLQGTASGFGCTPGRTGGGGIYAACNQDDTDGMGSYNLVIMPGGCDGTTTNPTCSGTDGAVTAKPWGPAGDLNWGDAYICNTNDFSCKGAKQAVTMMAMHSFGYGTFGAAAYCDAMVYNGKTDWYLPNQYELKSLIYTEKNAGNLTGFVNGTYWTSNQRDFGGDWNEVAGIDMTNGDVQNSNTNDRSTSRYVRCVRRDDLALPSAMADTSPNGAVSFLTSVTTSSGARVSSSVVTLTGFLQPLTVTVTSATGNPKVKINGGAEVSSGALTAINQTVQLVMDAPTVAGTKNTMTLTIGPDSYTWEVGYADSAQTAYVFVTSGSYKGNYGGVAGADDKCQTAATSAGYSGTWKAIISSSTVSASSRLPFNWGTLKLLDDTVVANGWNDLWDGSIQNAINLSEALTTITSGYAHTGTTSSGGIASSYEYTCNDWTASNWEDAYVGQVNATGSQWVYSTLVNCGANRTDHLYCISSGAIGTDTTPATFSIPYAIQVATSTLTTSNAVTISGLGSGVNATVTITGASGSPGFEVSTDGGTVWNPGTSGVTTVQNTHKLRLFLTSPAAASTTYLMTVTVGSGSAVNWRVWTGDPTGTVVKRVFVTAANVTGNGPGLSGMDAKCQSAADGATLGGTWKAILSGTSVEAEAAVNRIGYNWSTLKLVDNTTVVTLAGGLWSGAALTNPINKTQSGAVLNTNVTTNTKSDGLSWTTTAGQACNDWNQTGTYTGRWFSLGSSGSTGATWATSTSVENCNAGNDSYSLYCIEQ